MNTQDIDRLIDKIESSAAMDIAGRSKYIRDLRAAIEADRKRRGEPVAWRVHPFDYGVGYEGVYALTSRPDQVAAWERKGWEVQPLFTAPQPAESCASLMSNKTACGSENGNCDSQPAEPEQCFCDRMYPDSNPDASCGDCPTRDYGVKPAEPVKSKRRYAQGTALGEFGIIPMCDQVDDD